MRHTLLSHITFAALVGSASAQHELNIYITQPTPGHGVIYAQLDNPQGTIRAVISDLSFTMTGAGISNFSYNPAFDSFYFGPATVTASPNQIDFSGMNMLPPLSNPGGPDSSNPLHIATFDATLIWDFQINGQMTGAYVHVLDLVHFYQNANGTRGTVPFYVHIDPSWVPSPGATCLLGFAGFAAMRRRR